MIIVIMNIFFGILLSIFIFTKRFWEKNVFSLSTCLIFIWGMFNTYFSDGSENGQIFIVLSTLLIDIGIIVFILFGKIGKVSFFQILQDSKASIILAIFTLSAAIIKIITLRQATIYKNITLLAAVVFAPFIEEYCMRGIVFLHIQKQTSTWKRWILYLIVSVMFTAVHAPFGQTCTQLSAILLLSILCFTVRELWRSRYSFYCAWFMHLLYNLFAGWILWP